jgi:hypothetical protein
MLSSLKTRHLATLGSSTYAISFLLVYRIGFRLSNSRILIVILFGTLVSSIKEVYSFWVLSQNFSSCYGQCLDDYLCYVEIHKAA